MCIYALFSVQNIYKDIYMYRVSYLYFKVEIYKSNIQ